jgi:hypothetical protein
LFFSRRSGTVYGLAGIKFDDGLFVGNRLDFVAGRNAHDRALEFFLVQRQPVRHARLVAVSKFFVANWRETLLFLTSITSFTFSAYDGIDLAAVDRDVAVLTIWRAAARVFAKPR